jgi:hypothetical protein
VSEQEKNTEQSPEKGKKSFGNTIVLFIVFFIIFTALVTGVAFFADKLKRSGKDAKTTEQVKPEDMTNPDSGKSFTVDGDGNKTETAPAPAEPVVPKPVEAAPDPVLTAPPVEAKPAEPVKQPEPAKPAVKEEPVKPAAPAVKTEPVKAEPAKPAAKAEPVKAVAPAVKAETPKPAVKAEPVKPAVKAEPVKTAAPAVEKKAVVNKPGEYYVQLASFKSLDLAKEEFQRMSGKVNDLQLVQVDLGEKGVWYRLRCGTPLAYDKAVARAEEIAAKTGYKPDIMKK